MSESNAELIETTIALRVTLKRLERICYAMADKKPPEGSNVDPLEIKIAVCDWVLNTKEPIDWLHPPALVQACLDQDFTPRPSTKGQP